MWPFKVQQRDPETEAEHKLQQIRQLLFPTLELRRDQEGTQYHVDHSVDANIEAVLFDLEEGYNDEATRNTLNWVAENLTAVRKLLEAYPEINPEAKYFIVDHNSASIEDKVQAPDEY